MDHQIGTLELKKGTNLLDVEIMNVDKSYFQTLNLNLFSGRFFLADDLNHAIINESFAKQFSSNPIGERVFGKEIIGVVKDFHFQSFHEAITPLIIELNPENINQILIKLVKDFDRESKSKISEIIKANYPNVGFEIMDYNNKLKTIYENEFKLSALFKLFILLSFILVFSGLLGFVYHITQSKIKEVCIRKVHGAGTGSIIWIISKRLLPLIIISNIIALPISYYIINNLLNSFSIPTSSNLASFLLTFFSTFVFIFFMVIVRIKILLKQNVLKYLRYE
jgi:putative ABC transport system permease protein